MSLQELTGCLNAAMIAYHKQEGKNPNVVYLNANEFHLIPKNSKGIAIILDMFAIVEPLLNVEEGQFCLSYNRVVERYLKCK